MKPEEFKNREQDEEAEKIGNILDKIIAAVKSDPELLKRFFHGEFTPFWFIQAAGNHAFDDNPELFGITEMDGYRIRAWAQHKVKKTFSKKAAG